jgi:hypothetical protein|tara:strand:+ start:892 stop:1161 length:270 start_codon:yes stop_codon:yes gene_type:complete
MTDRQIEQMAIRVADIVIQALESKQKQWDTDLVAELQESLPTQDKEQRLLTELAEAMTALDYNLKQENYPRCAELKATILYLEKQLKQI